MPSVAGIRMRMSCESVMVGVELSVIVIVLAVWAACPTENVWFAAEDSVATEMICMVLSSVAAVAPPAPTMTNCRLLAADTAVKLVNLSPETVTWSRAAKLVVTSSTAVLLLSS